MILTEAVRMGQVQALGQIVVWVSSLPLPSLGNLHELVTLCKTIFSGVPEKESGKIPSLSIIAVRTQ